MPNMFLWKEIHFGVIYIQLLLPTEHEIWEDFFGKRRFSTALYGSTDDLMHA